MRHSFIRIAILAPLACAAPGSDEAIEADSTAPVAEAHIALDTPVAPPPRSTPRVARLSPAADTIAAQLTFVARNTTVLTAATRGGRWLVDLGRVDATITTPERLAAYREAVAARSPVRRGDTLHVYGPWGASRTTVREFDLWNGRIVAAIDLRGPADSLAAFAEQRARAPRGSDIPFAAAAFRFPLARDTAQTVSCVRDTLTPSLAARADSVSDSLRALLLADTGSAAPQYRVAPRIVSSRLAGCFGSAPLLVLVALRSGGDLLTRERAVLIDEDGSVTLVPVQDYRFRAHALLHVLDADGDGTDDVVARGYARRVGSLVILRFDPASGTLTRLTGGFAYEG